MPKNVTDNILFFNVFIAESTDDYSLRNCLIYHEMAPLSAPVG